MPRLSFTAQTVKCLKPPASGQIDYFDAGLPGFGCRVSYGGKKSWIVLYRHNGVKKRLTLGSAKNTSLADARDLAREALAQVDRGQDPAKAKQLRRTADTVADLAEAYLEEHAKPEKRSWKKDESYLKRTVIPELGTMKVADVTRAHVRTLFNAKKKTTPIAANRTLEVLRKMFNWAIENDRAPLIANPCSRIQKAEERSRERVLSPDEIRRFWRTLEEEPVKIRRYFRLLLLTGQRELELLQANWEEFDLESTWWTIPGSRTKNGLAHRVYLPEPTLAMLKAIRGEDPEGIYLFPQRGAGAPATRSMLQKPWEGKGDKPGIARRADLRGVVVHDLRRTAASGMASMGFSRLTVGRILNHLERGVTKIYDRHSYDPEKRDALSAWAARVMEIVSEQGATACR
jgi:integrase